MFNSSFSFKSISIIFILTILIPCLFIPFFYNTNSNSAINIPNLDSPIEISPLGFAWPTPGFTTITSKFGYRISPTGQPGNFHYGLDIGAPTGTTLVAICDGEIVSVGWTGSGGYAIILASGNLRISYCHASPNFYVHSGDTVTRGQILGMVGPKYVYDIPNNPYKDSTGNPTNGDMTGPHLHLTVRENGKIIDPLSLFGELSE